MIATKKTGWIGVDIGTRTVKFAQLLRDRTGLRLAAMAVIPRRQAWGEENLAGDNALSSADEINTAISLCPEFRGRRAAGSISMTLCDMHRLEGVPSTGPQQDRVIRQALATAAQCSVDHLQYDFWSEAPTQDQQEQGKTHVITIPRTWTDQLCQDIASTGWSCQLIDGLPFALARAIDMGQTEKLAGPVAALDWGYGCATFCVIAGGIPQYVRRLKQCDFQRVISSMTDDLNVTQEEAQLMLQNHGLLQDHGLSDTTGPRAMKANAGNDSSTDDTNIIDRKALSEVIEKRIAEPVSRLEEQLDRTLAHLKFQRKPIVPECIYLFGGGATIRGLDRRLAQRLSMEVQVWQMDQGVNVEASSNPAADCLFGPAVALSSLAWEKL